MHEMSIAQSVIHIVNDVMVKNQATALRSVHLQVGQLSAVVPESLRFCFEVITSGTNMEGAVLKMDITPLMGYCPACDEEFEIKEYTFICPTCGG
jgi:hydrogenase nickel incorporation protein HypA/HybF